MMSPDPEERQRAYLAAIGLLFAVCYVLFWCALLGVK